MTRTDAHLLEVEEMRAELARLRESERSYRTLIETCHDVIWALDAAGRITFVNRAVAVVYGREPEEILGRAFTDFIADDDRARFEAVFGEAVRSGAENVDTEVGGRRKDGTELVLSTNARILRDEEGRVIGSIAISRDMTEVRQAEKELDRQAAEQLELVRQLDLERARLAEAQSVASVGSWELDLRTNALVWSDENYRIFGIEKSESGTSYEAFLERVHPDDRETVNRAYVDSVANHAPYAVDHRTFTTDGRMRIVHERCQTFYDDEGTPIRSIGTTQDVTERRMAEASLYESRQALIAVLDSVPQRVFWKDCNSVYVGCNRHFAKDMGFDHPKDVIGKNDYDASWRASADLYRADDRRIVTSGQPELDYEEPMIRDGKEGWLRTSKVPLRGRDGSVTGLIGTYEDITVRKRSETRIADQAALLDKAQDAIFVRDLEHRISYWNKSAERLYGWTSAEATGQSARDLLRHDRGAYEAAMEALLENGEWIGELQTVIRGGAEVTVIARWTLVRDDAGGPRAVLAIDTNVTERKQLEQQLQHAQRLESIGTLAAGMAHEINNPLSYVLGNVAICREWLQAAILQLHQLPEGAADAPSVARIIGQLAEIEEPLRDASDGAERVRSLVLDIKNMAVTDDTSHTTRQVTTMVETAIRMTANAVRHSARIRTSFGATPLVETNDGPFVQVITNLLINAAQAIGYGNADANEITVTTATDAAGWACVEVRDTGPGIRPDVLARVFDPFFTTKRVGEGMGLGLSTSHSIVASLGGRLTAESPPGGGALFRVALPPAANARSISERAGQAEAAPQRCKVLVIDDERSVATALGRMLRDTHDVTLVTDGREALALVATGSVYDLIFCDLMMPNLSGIDVYHSIASTHGAQASKIVFMTGGAFTAAAQAFLDQVGGVHITKPFTPETVRSIAARCLSLGTST